jgi:PAS domain S-box-containing protein
MVSDLSIENRALRARIAELESGPPLIDPLIRALLANTPEFVVVVSREGRMLATGRVSERFGSTVGRTVFEFSDPESHAILRAALAKACDTGETVWYESTGYGEDGSPGHHYRVRAVPLGAPGEVTGVMLVPTDITDYVKLERAVRESKEALQHAVDATGIGLWRWNLGENKLEWDDRVKKIFGVTEAPPSYEAYLEHVHPTDRTKVELAVRQALETGYLPPSEHRLRDLDGRSRHVLVVGTVIKDASGKPSVVTGGVLDISEQKRMEAQVSRAARVEAVGQLTAGIAHNFNNLLAVIIPSLELSMPDASATARPELEAAFDAAIQAREVVASLLSLAREKTASHDALADPKEVARRVEAICRATFPREIRLTWSVDASVGAVAMSATELEQVLLNLLVNARDALEAFEPAQGEGREVRVIVERSTHAGVPRVRIRVVDNGEGMTEEVRARVFETFFTTKPPHRGSGLGLSNALLRVREAGGELDCASTRGAGAAFELLLPEIEPRATKALPPKSRGAARGETVLLVDDEPMVRRTLRRLLELEGYAVLEAETADGARAVLGSAAGAGVRLIILDESMPAQSGSAAVASLRALSRAPIILFSGMLLKRPSGVSAVLEKPALARDLWRVVREVLDAAALHAE